MVIFGNTNGDFFRLGVALIIIIDNRLHVASQPFDITHYADPYPGNGSLVDVGQGFTAFA